MANEFASLGDAHNVLNTGTSWSQPESFSQRLGNAGKFIAVSAASGVNSLYNSAVAISNVLGNDAKERDTSKWIKSLDSDWGKYYEGNKEDADLAGFVATSLIPGLAGQKLFNLGQNMLRAQIRDGVITGNMARVTGLLVSRRDDYLEQSANLIKQSLTTTSRLNTQTTLALASGVKQNILESLAAETMVAVTMFKSPTLDDMTVTDLVKNIATGGLLGGAIGGSIDAARSFSFLNKSISQESKRRLPWLKGSEQPEAMLPTDKNIDIYNALENVPFPARVNVNDPTQPGRDMKLFGARVSRDLNTLRSNILEMSGKANTYLANTLADMFSPQRGTAGEILPGGAQNYYDHMNGALGIVKYNKKHKLEEAAEKAIKEGKVPDKNVAVRYIDLEDGKMLDSKPVEVGLADIYDSEAHIVGAINGMKFKHGSKFDIAENGLNGYRDALLRFAWAHNRDLSEVKVLTAHENDIPLMQRAYEAWNEGGSEIIIYTGKNDAPKDLSALVPDGRNIIRPQTRQELFDILKERKELLAAELKSKAKEPGAGELISRMLDIKHDYLLGTHSKNIADDILATSSRGAAKQQELMKRGLSGEDEIANPWLRPRYAKVIYGVDDKYTSPHVVHAMVDLELKKQSFIEQARHVTARYMGDIFKQLPDFTARQKANLDARDPAASLVASADAAYGSFGANSIQIGKLTATLEQRFTKEVNEALESPLTQLGRHPDQAIQFEAVNNFVAKQSELMTVREIPEQGWFVMPVRAADQLDGAAKQGEDLDVDDLFDEMGELMMEIKPHRTSQGDEIHATLDAIKAHMDRSGKNTGMRKDIAAAYGKENDRRTDVFRPVRPNPKDYPYFAFVYDPRVTGSGHVSMIHAATEKELAAMVDKVPDHYQVGMETGLHERIKVRTKMDVEAYKRARGEFDFERSLHENYINSELASKGVYSRYFMLSDPKKIIDGILRHHTNDARTAAKDLVRLHYQPEFDMLEEVGKEYSRYATSKFGGRTEMLEKTSDNPYFNQVKTALNISNISEHNLIYGANKALDSAVSRAYGAIVNTLRETKTKADLELVNAEMQKYGYQPGFYDASLHMLANHEAPKGVLTSFVRRANSMLSLFTLGLDPLNAVNNAIGSNILRLTELASVNRAIRDGNEELAGELAQLAKVKLPGGDNLGDILSSRKLTSQAIENLLKDGANGPLTQKYKAMGLISDRVEQLALLVDDFTLKGTETVAELTKREDTAFARVKKFFAEGGQVGEKWSGNKFVEEANRFIAANVMDQITQLAIKHGIMDERAAGAYINTFVNRVEGSILAAQRPLVFQGPIGQAVGLFQRYQFNLLQQLFRYAGEGTKKDIGLLLGLQSTLYGAQSLPAFQFVNQHIIGTASGNTEHKDLYTATYGIAGKTAGDWLLYGVPSNILNANIYSRGDINPRHITILPTNIQDIPLVQGWGKFLGNAYETLGKMTGSGDGWTSFLQGLEHNGISRPLAGLSQVLGSSDGVLRSTSSKGTLMYENDLTALSGLVKIAGGRTLDEAVAVDAYYRNVAYKAADTAKRTKLGEVIKSTMIGGRDPTPEQVEAFAEDYARTGGNQKQFNKYMLGLYKDATESQAEQLRANLNSPFSRHMQLIMGGDEE